MKNGSNSVTNYIQALSSLIGLPPLMGRVLQAQENKSEMSRSRREREREREREKERARKKERERERENERERERERKRERERERIPRERYINKRPKLNIQTITLTYLTTAFPAGTI